MNTIQLPTGKLTMNIGLNYGNAHPEATYRGSAMATNRAIDVIVPVLTQKGFQGFTVNESIGFWEGKPERSLEVYTYGATAENCQAWLEAAEIIRKELWQDAVLVSIDNDARASLVTGD